MTRNDYSPWSAFALVRSSPSMAPRSLAASLRRGAFGERRPATIVGASTGGHPALRPAGPLRRLVEEGGTHGAAFVALALQTAQAATGFLGPGLQLGFHGRHAAKDDGRPVHQRGR